MPVALSLIPASSKASTLEFEGLSLWRRTCPCYQSALISFRDTISIEVSRRAAWSLSNLDLSVTSVSPTPQPSKV